MRKITSKTLPDWFQLERYALCETFNLRDWFANLVRRALIYNETEIFLNEFGRYWEKNAERLLVEKIPLGSTQDTQTSPQGKYDDSDDDLITTTIRPIDLYFPAWIMLQLSREPSPLLVQLRDSVKALHADAGDDELDSFLSSSIDSLDLDVSLSKNKMDSPIAHAAIDLAAPDELILKDLKKWLGVVRARYGLPEAKLFSTAEQRKWRSLQILPYLDLIIWGKVESVELPYAVIANALFAGHVDIDIVDKVRRVVKPKAEFLVRYDTIEIMERQVLYPA